MKHFNLRINETLAQVIRMATSTERLRQHFRIPLYTGAYYLMARSAVNATLGFVFWIVVAKFYTPADVGLAAALIAAMGLSVSLSNLGLGFGLIRFLSSAAEKAKAVINSTLTIGGLASIVAALIFLAGIGLWSPALLFVQQNPIFLTSFVLFTLVLSLASLLDSVFIAKRSAKFVFVKHAITSSLKIPIVIVLATMFGAFGIFASLGLATFVALVMAVLWFLPKVQPGYIPLPVIRKEVVNETIHYSLGNYIADLLWTAPAMLLPLMVVNILGAEMNAYFYMAWMTANLLFSVPLAISFSLFAEGAHDEKLFRSNITRAVKLALLLLIPLILVIFGIGGKVLLLFGRAYSQSGTMLLWVLAVSAIPVSINYIYMAINRVRFKIRSVVVMSAAIACLALGLSYFLMTGMGLLGIGIGWLIAQTLVAAAMMLFAKR